MARESFQKALSTLQQEVLEMGKMVKTATERAMASLKSRDIQEAKRIIAEDRLINQKRWDIEERCIATIATQQPVARDLRIIVTILNIIVDLERMADHAEGIAKITVMMGDDPFVKPLIDIPRMAEKAVGMLDRSLQAFINRDAEAARMICIEDDEVDGLYDQIFRELILFMLDDPHAITRATYLIWTAHNLERIADRTTNICERVAFLVTGKMEEINVSKY